MSPTHLLKTHLDQCEGRPSSTFPRTPSTSPPTPWSVPHPSAFRGSQPGPVLEEGLLFTGGTSRRLAEAQMALTQGNTQYPESSFDDLSSGSRRDVKSPPVLPLWLYDVLMLLFPDIFPNNSCLI